MKHIFKKSTALLLTCFMVLGMIPTGILAADNTTTLTLGHSFHKAVVTVTDFDGEAGDASVTFTNKNGGHYLYRVTLTDGNDEYVAETEAALAENESATVKFVGADEQEVTTLALHDGHSFKFEAKYKNTDGTALAEKWFEVVATSDTGPCTNNVGFDFVEFTVDPTEVTDAHTDEEKTILVNCTETGALVRFTYNGETTEGTFNDNGAAEFHFMPAAADKGPGKPVEVLVYHVEGKLASKKTVPVTLADETYHTITFDMNGHGEQVPPQTVADGDLAVEPNPAPTEDGWTFVAWHIKTHGNDGNPLIFPMPFDFNTPIRADKVLAAEWKENKIEMTVDPDEIDPAVDGEEYTITVTLENTNEGYVQFTYNGKKVRVPVEPIPGGKGEAVFTFNAVRGQNQVDIVAYNVPGLADGNAVVELTFDPVYIVTFEMNGYGEQVPEQAVAPDTPATEPETPTAEGYVFKGWYADDNPDVMWDFTTPVRGDMTLKALWVIAHTITFDPKGAGEIEVPAQPAEIPAQIVADNDLATEPASPTADGWTFVGWVWGEDSYPNTIYHDFDFAAPVTRDYDLVARWTRNTVTVTFDEEEHAVTALDTSAIVDNNSDETDGFQVYQNDTIEFTVTVPEGYDPATLVVTANGAALNPVEINGTAYKFSYTAKADTEIKIGALKKFVYTISMSVGDHYTGGILPDMTIYGTVEHGDSYSFTVRPDNGAKYPIKAVYVNGKLLDGNFPSSAQMSFTIDNVTENQTIQVVMGEMPDYTVTYIVRDRLYMTQKVTQAVSGNTTVTPPDNPVVDGYTFVSWNTKQDGSGDTFDAAYAITGDLVVYAQLEAITGTIKYDMNANGDETDPASIPDTVKTWGQAVQLDTTVPTRDGYNFKGWSTKADGPLVYQPGDTYSTEIAMDDTGAYVVTLYAVWEAKTYTVETNSGTGFTVDAYNKTVEYGGTVEITFHVEEGYREFLPTVTISPDEGYTYTLDPATAAADGNYTIKLENVKTDIFVSINVTKNETYTVTFYTALQDEPVVTEVYQTQEVEYNKNATQPAAPVVEGYTFKGWFTSEDADPETDTPYDFSTPVTENLALYAIMDPIVLKVTLPDEPVAPADGWTIDPDSGEHEVAYGENFEFIITVAEGFDASNMAVAANGVALTPVKTNVDAQGASEYTFIIYNVKEDQVVTVVGVVRKTITITYVDNGGEGGPGQEVVNYYVEGREDNGTISEVEPTRVGYTFVGWALTNDAKPGDDGIYKPGNVADFKADTTLYAVWAEKVATITLTADVDEQYEGKDIVLTAEVTNDENNVISSGTVIFYRVDRDNLDNPYANSERIGTATVAANLAIITVQASDWIFADLAKENNVDYFWAEFIPDEGDGYTACDTLGKDQDDFVEVEILSTAITWELANNAGALAENANVLTIKDEEGNAVDSMVAGHQYTLTLPTVYALDDYKKLVADTDYTVEWQYLAPTGDWVTYTDGAAGDTCTVYPEYSQYSFRAKVTPLAGATTEYLKAAKYNEDNDPEVYTAIVPDEYAAFLLTKATEKTEKEDVNVTVTIVDKIASTEDVDVYQLDELTIYAEVAPAGESAEIPDGTVTFYYLSEDGEYIKIGAAELEKKDGIMKAEITTTALPVAKETNTKLDVKVTAVYEGNKSFNASGTYDEENKSITVADDYEGKTTDATVTVWSSVIYVNKDVENVAGFFDATHDNGIVISVDGGAVLANETSVTLTISDIYTLDHPELAALKYGVDYDVKWQILNNVAVYEDDLASAPWEDLGVTGLTCKLNPVKQGSAYRAVVTALESVPTMGSYSEIAQDVSGRRVYYSNILMTSDGETTLTVTINTSNTDEGYEGIVEGETVKINTYAAGASGTTPISQITATVVKDGEEVWTETKTDVNGYTYFEWPTEEPGFYTLTIEAKPQNGYEDIVITRELIVRDDNYSFDVIEDTFVYDGKLQGLDVKVTDMCDDFDAMAQAEWYVLYYDADGNMVEPTQAGEYKAVIKLAPSAYWTAKTMEATLTIEQRKVSVADLVAQAKIYDGTKNANLVEVVLADAKTDETTGLPNEDTGVINGDSIYATGKGVLSNSKAGERTLSVTNVVLGGDDAANYVIDDTSYTEKIIVQRSQVKGAIAPSTYQFTGDDLTVPAEEIYLIDQQGFEIAAENYEVTYYYHHGEGVEKVDAMNKLGMYTVIARPDQDNYKGGAVQTIYVVEDEGVAAEVDKSAVSALITINDTVELFSDELKGVSATATTGEIDKIEYHDGGWTTTVPAKAGRYLVKVTASTGDVAYGIYTIVKAHPVLTLSAEDMEYDSARYDGKITFVNESDDSAEVYGTAAGDHIRGAAYEAPTEVGQYIVTAHVGETENYTSHEVSAPFAITPKALTITADSWQRRQYGAFPDMTATFDGLATEGVAPDTSLRDVQIQPEFIYNSYENVDMTVVGSFVVEPISALATNYAITYVNGQYTVTDASNPPKPELAIHGMIDSGLDYEIAYYGDEIQLYAYGNMKDGVENNSSVYTWEIVSGPATITEQGLLKFDQDLDPGYVVIVKLTRGIGAEAISTEMTISVLKKEIKVIVPAYDLVYNGEEQVYDETLPYASEGDAAVVILAGDKRTDIGTNIVLSVVDPSEVNYLSEDYYGPFTINDKEVTVAPAKPDTVTYGDLVEYPDPKYTEEGIVNDIAALTDAEVVSVADVYNNLDVANWYEILLAGRENMNYNVKYVTANDAETVEIEELDLTVTLGSHKNTEGITNGSLDPEPAYPENGAEVAELNFEQNGFRMYGEPNRVMDYVLEALIEGDSEADLDDLLDKLVIFEELIDSDANIKYTDPMTDPTTATYDQYMEGVTEDYVITDEGIDFVNYDVTVIDGAQNIYQRPVTLRGPDAENPNEVDLFIDDLKDEDSLLAALEAVLVAEKYTDANGNEVGGLATLLKHTIADLDLQIVCEPALADITDDTESVTVTITIGNPNYWMEPAFVITVNILRDYYRVDYVSFGRTSATVTLTHVYPDGHEEQEWLPGDSKGKVSQALKYVIYAYDTESEDQSYDHYKELTPLYEYTMKAGTKPGKYTVSYKRLPAGKYKTFAVAEGYTLIGEV